MNKTNKPSIIVFIFIIFFLRSGGEEHLPKSAILNCYMLFACITDVKGLVRESSSPRIRLSSELFKFYILMWTKNGFWLPTCRIYTPSFSLSNEKCNWNGIYFVNKYICTPHKKKKRKWVTLKSFFMCRSIL